MQTDQTTVTLSRPGSKPHEQIDIVIPATLGSVRLLTQIGQGGMGIVYRGRDQLLNRDVAVKFLTNAIAAPDDPNFSAFLEGARSAAALQHASLTTVHQAGVVENVPYIVMQFVDGPTVSQLMKSTGPLNQFEAMAILIDVAAAIAELHDRNIIHRDVKPSNVLLDPDGRVIVSDFGLAHRHRRGTASHPSSGTPAYMAPEMFSGEVTLRSDVYALGIMGFELLAGKLPFRGDVTQTQEQHKSAPLPLAELKDVPAEILDILERAAHKNAMFRHKSARQFLRALQSATDSAKIAQGRYSILQRITGARSSPDTAPATAPPEPSTYFDHLSKIAASKRSQRSSIEPPPLENRTRHCLFCGYNRLGLEESQPCPECGRIDAFDEHQLECLKFAHKPGRIFWRLLTFRAPPAGWWETFDELHLHRFTPLRTSLLILCAAILTAAVMAGGNFIANDLQVQRSAKAYLYRTDDPEKKKFSDYAQGSETTSIFDRSPRGTYIHIPENPMPGFNAHVDWQEKFVIRRLKLSEYILYPVSVIVFIICSWVVYRSAWLAVILGINSQLAPEDREAARRAMPPLALVFLALPVGMFIVLLMMIALRTQVSFPTWTFNIIAGFMLLYPPFLIRRAIRADVSGRIFPNRPLATLFLAAAALVNSIILAISMGTASLLIRVLNSA
jgi:serine/threonine protein kinase